MRSVNVACRCRYAFAAVALVVAGGCSNSSASRAAPATSTATSVGGVPRIPCERGYVVVPSPDDGNAEVLGRFALAGPADKQALPLVRSADADPQRRLWTKIGLGVRGDSIVELSTAEGESFWFAWSSADKPSQQLTVGGCGADWRFFPGGFWTDRPKCVHLVVRIDGDTATLPVGLGEPCPGQLPPSTPSQN